MQNSNYLDVEQTAQLLNVSVSFLNKARVYGDGPPFVKFAKAVRYDKSKVLAWAESQTRRSTSDRGEAA